MPPPIVAALVAALMYWTPALFPFGSVEVPWRLGISALLFALGAALDIAGLVHFLRAKTTVNPLDPGAASVLITGGVYRFTRNPMYLGLATLLGAWAIWLENAVALAGVALFVWAMNRLQIAPEERALEARFGAEYSRYRSRVRRWI